jgi:Transposase
MHGAHIGGQRAGAFLELVRGVDPQRVLLVGVDVAKATWFVVAANLLGEVVVDGVRLVADVAGLAELERLIATTRSRLDARVVVVGVEAAGHHHQTLVGHLSDREELVVRLLNPGQVAAARKQQGNRRRKTDWLDAAAICELLARGEGSPVHLDASPAATLRPLWSGRKDLVDARGRLRQQAGALVDCLWPGLSATDKHAGVAPVLSSPFDTRRAGWWWGCWPRAGPRQRCRDQRGWVAPGLRRSRLPAVTAPGRTAHRPGRRRAACPPGRHRRQASHPGWAARRPCGPGRPDRPSGGRDGPAARHHPGRQAAPDPRGGHRRRSRDCRLRGPYRPLGGLVQGVAGGRAGPHPPPIRRHRPKLWHQPRGLGLGRRAILDLAASVCRQPGRFNDSYQARLRHTSTPRWRWPPLATRSDGPALP